MPPQPLRECGGIKIKKDGAHPMLQRRNYAVALSVAASVPCHGYFFHFARIVKCRAYYDEIRGRYTITNRLNDYIVVKSKGKGLCTCYIRRLGPT